MALTGALAAAAGGYVVKRLTDAPLIIWSTGSAFLFGLFVSMSFSSVLGLLANGIELREIARGDVFNRVAFGVALISGFLAPVLAGILSNLVQEQPSEFGEGTRPASTTAL